MWLEFSCLHHSKFVLLNIYFPITERGDRSLPAVRVTNITVNITVLSTWLLQLFNIVLLMYFFFFFFYLLLFLIFYIFILSKHLCSVIFHSILFYSIVNIYDRWYIILDQWYIIDMVPSTFSTNNTINTFGRELNAKTMCQYTQKCCSNKANDWKF